ncbi:MAG: hypothetical protein NVS9B4_26580 [Candidatus Acidiferrum sp.]
MQAKSLGIDEFKGVEVQKPAYIGRQAIETKGCVLRKMLQ